MFTLCFALYTVAEGSGGVGDIDKAKPPESDRPAVEDTAEETTEAAGKQPMHVAEEEEGPPSSKPGERREKELEKEGTLKPRDGEMATDTVPPPTNSTLTNGSQARRLSGELASCWRRKEVHFLFSVARIQFSD